MFVFLNCEHKVTLTYTMQDKQKTACTEISITWRCCIPTNVARPERRALSCSIHHSLGLLVWESPVSQFNPDEHQARIQEFGRGGKMRESQVFIGGGTPHGDVQARIQDFDQGADAKFDRRETYYMLVWGQLHTCVQQARNQEFAWGGSAPDKNVAMNATSGVLEVRWLEGTMGSKTQQWKTRGNYDDINLGFYWMHALEDLLIIIKFCWQEQQKLLVALQLGPVEIACCFRWN